jgi:hypothetical protein
LEGADIQEVLNTHTAELTEEESEDMTTLSENHKMQKILMLLWRCLSRLLELKKGLQMADDVAISLKLTVSWIGATNSSTNWRLS